MNMQLINSDFPFWKSTVFGVICLQYFLNMMLSCKQQLQSVFN